MGGGRVETERTGCSQSSTGASVVGRGAVTSSDVFAQREETGGKRQRSGWMDESQVDGRRGWLNERVNGFSSDSVFGMFTNQNASDLI